MTLIDLHGVRIRVKAGIRDKKTRWSHRIEPGHINYGVIITPDLGIRGLL